MNALEPALAGRRQGGANFRGMVAVVVDHADFGGAAAKLKAAVDAAEVLQRLAYALGSDIKPDAHGHGCRSVQHVVTAGNAQVEIAQRLAPVLHGKMRIMPGAGAFSFVHSHAKIRVFMRAVGGGAASQTGQHAAEPFVVMAEHGHAVKGDAVNKIEKSLLYVGHVAVAIHVLAVNVGDHGENGRQLEKGAVALVSFSDQILRLAETRVGAHGVHAPADHDRGIEPAGCQNRSHHAGGGGFAMHAGDGDPVFQTHQLGQHLRALDHRDKLGVRGGNFGVIAADGGAGDDDLRARDVFRAMAFEDDGAFFRQAFGDGRGLKIGPGDFIAEREQDLGNAAHADAADTYKVYSLYFCKHDSVSLRDKPLTSLPFLNRGCSCCSNRTRYPDSATC